jgi:ketosteroid isomerase-like protein
MTSLSSATEAVIRNHLQAFKEHRGLDAILADYRDDASFLAEEQIYSGKAEIRRFFERFIQDLPPDAIERFELRSLRVVEELAYITWSAGSALPLGTDTFVVKGGKIASQTCAIYASRAG